MRDLRVVAREYVVTFKDKNEDVHAIGRALAARHLVEGSVRKADDRVGIPLHIHVARS
jgi:TolB-like protein